jgi:hypothetical protein
MPEDVPTITTGRSDLLSMRSRNGAPQLRGTATIAWFGNAAP